MGLTFGSIISPLVTSIAGGLASKVLAGQEKKTGDDQAKLVADREKRVAETPFVTDFSALGPDPETGVQTLTQPGGEQAAEARRISAGTDVKSAQRLKDTLGSHRPFFGSVSDAKAFLQPDFTNQERLLVDAIADTQQRLPQQRDPTTTNYVAKATDALGDAIAKLNLNQQRGSLEAFNLQRSNELANLVNEKLAFAPSVPAPGFVSQTADPRTAGLAQTPIAKATRDISGAVLPSTVGDFAANLAARQRAEEEEASLLRVIRQLGNQGQFNV